MARILRAVGYRTAEDLRAQGGLARGLPGISFNQRLAAVRGRNTGHVGLHSWMYSTYIGEGMVAEE